MSGLGGVRRALGGVLVLAAVSLVTPSPPSAPTVVAPSVVFLSAQYVQSVVRERALAYGVPPEWLLMVSQCESNNQWNAVGDHGTSFGVFQLHRPGMLNLFYEEGFHDPFNVYEATTFTARQFRLGNARAWACAR